MLSLYSPSPIHIPPDTPTKRMAPPVTNPDNEPYDRTAVFYDVFVAPDRKKLHCVGPPFYDLGPPQSVCSGRNRLRFSCFEPSSYSVNRAAITTVQLPRGRLSEELPLRFSFRDFALDHVVAVQHDPVPEGVTFTISTLQKDNHVEWVRDWCVWHHRKHGVRRIVIYDNGSCNLDELTDILRNIEGPDLFLVPWNHPFGPFALKFPQTAALNHCRLLFARNSKWCINLDVDEYLYNDTELDLDSLLNRPSYGNRCVVYLRSHVVPHVVERNPARCFDSAIRLRRFSKDQKYIYRPTTTLLNEVHWAIKKRGLASLWRQARIVLRRFLKNNPKLHGAYRRIRRLSPVGSPPCHADTRQSRTSMLPTGPVQSCLGDDLFFFHFRALNTGWKQERKIVGVEDSEVVMDSRIVAMRDTFD